MKNQAFRKCMAGLLILGLVMSTGCGKAKEKEADYVINSIPKKASADEIPSGYSAFAVEKWDLSLCYPSEAEIDYNKKSGVTILLDEEEGQEIRIRKDDEKAREPDEIFKDITKELSEDFSKLKESEVEETKVGKRTLYFQEYSSKDAGIDVYVEIYESCTLVYMAIAEENGDLEAVLNTIIASVVWDAEAYDDIEPPPPPGGSTIQLSSETYSLAITVPEEELTEQDCPVGIFCVYPNYEIGAIYMNSDPIGSCVYDAEDMLSSMILYDGMFEALLLVDDATIGNYFDSSFNGTPEIDAEFTYSVNGAFGAGYARFINGPGIGCYLVFYKVLDQGDADANTAALEVCSKAIETFEILGEPQVTKFDPQTTPFDLRYVVRAGTYSDIVYEDSSGNVYVMGIDTADLIEIGEENANVDVDGSINNIIDRFSTMSNFSYTVEDYTNSRYLAKILRFTFDQNGQTYYVAYAAITLGNNVTYYCDYLTTDPDVSVEEQMLDDFLWSANVPT
ncbi:MAG: hypothetical protein J6Y08_00600 [Clostridiales bacterium]|nr:hypothetical protein [Clostridiales bacterium]